MIWLGKFSSDTLLNFFCAIVARGYAVQKILNFPAKSLIFILILYIYTYIYIYIICYIKYIFEHFS